MRTIKRNSIDVAFRVEMKRFIVAFFRRWRSLEQGKWWFETRHRTHWIWTHSSKTTRSKTFFFLLFHAEQKPFFFSRFRFQTFRFVRWPDLTVILVNWKSKISFGTSKPTLKITRRPQICGNVLILNPAFELNRVRRFINVWEEWTKVTKANRRYFESLRFLSMRTIDRSQSCFNEFFLLSLSTFFFVRFSRPTVNSTKKWNQSSKSFSHELRVVSASVRLF